MDEETAEQQRDAKWRWQCVLIHGFVLAANVAQDTAKFMASIAQELASDYNYRSEREAFREQAALEIEQLLEGDDGGEPRGV